MSALRHDFRIGGGLVHGPDWSIYF
jgi:hypothetical protein